MDVYTRHAHQDAFLSRIVHKSERPAVNFTDVLYDHVRKLIGIFITSPA